MPSATVPKPTALRIALVYAIAGVLYISLSDTVLTAIAGNWQAYQTLQTLKGWAFIGLTSVALWLVLRADWVKLTGTLVTVIATEDKLRMALTAAAGAVWQARSTPGGGLCLIVTGGLARTLGLPEDVPITPADLANRVHPDDRDDFRAHLQMVQDGATVISDLTCRFQTPDLGIRWVKIIPDLSSRTKSPDGALFGVAFDVSDTQQTAKDLAEVVAGAELGTWRFETRTKRNVVNEGWANLIGYTLAELGPVGLPELRRLVHPEDIARIEANFLAEPTTGPHYFSDEIRMRHKQGHWVWILTRGRTVEYSPTGEAEVISGVHIDISRRKSLEVELKAERDFLLGLTETSVSGIVALDSAGKLVFANKEAERILGLTTADLVGRAHDDARWNAKALDGTVLAPEDFLYARVVRTGEVVRDFRVRFDKPDGQERIISVNVAPMTSREGAVQAVCALTDITDNLSNELRLSRTASDAQFAALHDHMTGLPNRELFEDQLEVSITQANQSNSLLLQIYIDLDNFKQINDRFGHRLGDRLICSVADRLQTMKKDRQFLARIGGDEFVFLHPLDAGEDPASILGQMTAAFETAFELAGQDIYLSASMGVSIYPLDSASSDETWLNSDLAMYEAKSLGRNQTVQFSAELRNRLAGKANIAQLLRRAIRERAFTLVLQPKVDLASPGRIVGAEALLRCLDPALAGIGPSDFIPIAEKAGLIRSIDLMVVDMLGVIVADLRGSGLTLPISANLSPDSLRQVNFAKALLGRLAVARLGPSDVIFELTEGTMIDLNSNAHDNIEVLLAQGYELSADDFGTGYSSLSYLHQLRLREVKIDRSFVARLGMQQDGSDAIVRAILAMAKALGLRTVAEGIENQAQLDWLIGHGCCQGQGYLFGKGVPPTEFANLYLQPQLMN